MKKRVKWVSDNGSIELPTEKAVRKYLKALLKKYGEYQEIGFRRVEY